jgi:hypothetical protein
LKEEKVFNSGVGKSRRFKVSHCLQFRAWLLRSFDGSEGGTERRSEEEAFCHHHDFLLYCFKVKHGFIMYTKAVPVGSPQPLAPLASRLLDVDVRLSLNEST